MKIAILKEHINGETRIAVSPKTAKSYQERGCHLVMQKDAGLKSGWLDSVYIELGVQVRSSLEDTLKGADVCLKIQPPSLEELDVYPSGLNIVSLANPYEHQAIIEKSLKKNVCLFSLSMIPRISRAQSMDIVSSQANLAGYRAVIEAAYAYQGLFPMLMTAAGAIRPAKIFIMGAGIAGLQAIATAKRLGAVLSATDVRPATKEQVESLGAKFIAVEDEEFKKAEADGGHAKSMSKAYQEKQARLIQSHIKDMDIIITTALIPGKKSPLLIDKSMLSEMKYGSIIIDLAVSQGGNVYGVKPESEVNINGVRVFGFYNLVTKVSKQASILFANNVLKYFNLLQDDKGNFSPKIEDEIIKSTCLNPNLRS